MNGEEKRMTLTHCTPRRKLKLCPVINLGVLLVLSRFCTVRAALGLFSVLTGSSGDASLIFLGFYFSFLPASFQYERQSNDFSGVVVVKKALFSSQIYHTHCVFSFFFFFFFVVFVLSQAVCLKRPGCSR